VEKSEADYIHVRIDVGSYLAGDVFLTIKGKLLIDFSGQPSCGLLKNCDG